MAGVLDGGADLLGAVADDDVDVGGGDDLERGVDDVEQQRSAADGVQDFGAFGLEPGAFAGGEDGDGESHGCDLSAVNPACGRSGDGVSPVRGGECFAC
jgi:hypothetical protein